VVSISWGKREFNINNSIHDIMMIYFLYFLQIFDTLISTTVENLHLQCGLFSKLGNE